MKQHQQLKKLRRENKRLKERIAELYRAQKSMFLSLKEQGPKYGLLARDGKTFINES